MIRIEQDETTTTPAGSGKPYGQAVSEVYRELNKTIQKREDLDGSIKETVTKELDDLADKHEKKKPWLGSMP
jgi:hypothetical protein